MTAERLARLREWTTGAAGSELGFVYSDGVLRLLDEREALLEAAKRLMDADLEGYDSLCDLRAAIAKAESP